MSPPIRKRGAPAQGAPPKQQRSAKGNGTDGSAPDAIVTFPMPTPEEVLVMASGIDVEIAEARGYQLVTSAQQVRSLGFSQTQCRTPGLLIPMHSVVAGEGVVNWQYRPRRPRTDPATGCVRKYESRPGSRNRLDCHPSIQRHLADTRVPLWITEGVRKADAAVSLGLCCIALAGVDSWCGTRSDGTRGPLEDWDHVALEGREVFVAYDSDVMRKEAVKDALRRLTVYLAVRRAKVRWVYLPEGPIDLASGERGKVGLDDYLARGHDEGDLRSLARCPELAVVGGQLHDQTVAAIAALHVANDPPFVFQRADVLVQALATGVQELSKDQGRYLMGKHVKWLKVVKDGRVPANPDVQVVANVLVAVEEWPFPPLNRVVYSPVFAQDGTLVVSSGYNETSGMLHVPPKGLTIPAVPDRPSRVDVKRALSLFMDELFREFPFVDEADRAHALALALQPFARDLIRGNTPLYGVEAPKQGTGKTLLVESALAPALGDVDLYAEPHGDEEMEKRITAALASAQPLVGIDNVTRAINYGSLASALTKPMWSGRILGESSRITAPVTCTWVLTANNPQYSDDIARRVVPIRLDAQVEAPQQRHGFKRSLPGWALDNRGELIWAACVLVAHWLALGRPKPLDAVPHLGKFGPWRRVMGGILQALEVPGLLGNLAHLQGNSPETEAFRLLAQEVIAIHGLGGPFNASTVVDIAREEPELASAIDPGSRSSPQGLAARAGWYLKQRVGQVIGGWRLTKVPRGKSGGQRYAFVPAEARQ